MRSLDIAVQSRIREFPPKVYLTQKAKSPIDLAIKFFELSPFQKVSIFTSFLDQLDDKKLVDDRKDVNEWIKEEGKIFEFNGRQIRNVISTALGIALAEKRKMRRRDLAIVARQTDNFKRELSAQEAIYRDRQINSRS
jgi:7-cyano-7-deazaguanine synthase in queuosine biosynthesis